MVHPNPRRVELNGAELEYWDIGSGPPVMLNHGGMGIECAAILNESALTSRFRLIHLQRRGYGNSECPSMPVSLDQQVADVLALLDSLGISKAHVAGQSYGGLISLQIARDARARVHTLTLVEPALPDVVFRHPEFAEPAQRAGGLYQAGQSREAIDLFAHTVNGEQLYPAFANDWLERWYPDAQVIFESDLPAMGTWSFGADAVSTVGRCPVLNLYGSESPEALKACAHTVADLFPHAETHALPDTSHCAMQLSPEKVATLMVDFFDRHPLR